MVIFKEEKEVLRQLLVFGSSEQRRKVLRAVLRLGRGEDGRPGGHDARLEARSLVRRRRIDRFVENHSELLEPVAGATVLQQVH